MSVIGAEQRVHILGEEIDTDNSSTVSVPGAFLATEHWVDLVDATEEDGHEHGYVVGINRRSEPVLTERMEGPSALVGEDGREIESASGCMPSFPFGILRAARIKPVVFVHTHPMPTFEYHARTRIFSDKDIRYFVGSDLLAMVMLDQGGAHLMAKKERVARDPWSLHPKLVESTVADVGQDSRSMRDVLGRVANQLSIHGDIGYYYTPDLSQTDDMVEFQNLRRARAVLTPAAR